ncbi:hypothetical protein JW826_01675 [Candidatus Woesearchaeota archaeon]|nr:hypothetical protein [Candidatus Woesearchaeota archaeon]
MAQVKRETATVCMIDDLLNGSFVKTEGWNPSYFDTGIGRISRASLFGVIVSKDDEGAVLDDGSGRMLLRSFEENSFNGVGIGDFVLIVGRPRAYSDQKYLTPEIIRKIDPRWGGYRKIQLEMSRRNAPVIVKPKENKVLIKEENELPVNHYQKIVEFIRDLDSGSGADVDEVMKRSGAPNSEEFVRKLIEEGEIFEIKPGKLKVLE